MLHQMRTLLIVVAALVGFAAPAYAQELTSPWEGRHFLLAFPDTTTNLRDPINLPPTLDTIALVMYSPKGTHVAITGPGGYQRSVTLPAGEPTEVYLDDKENPATRIINDISGVVSRDVFSVEADDPITLYCWMMTPFGGEAWTPLPVEKWGKEYQVISARPHVAYDALPASRNGASWGLVTWKPRPAPVYMIMIADSDDTEIEIVLLKHSPNGGHIARVHLNAGESYQLQWSDTGSYLSPDSTNVYYQYDEPSGTMIRASKPIGLVGGASRASELYDYQPLWANHWCNSAVEWLLPVSLCDSEGVLPALYRKGYSGVGATGMIGIITNPSSNDASVNLHYGNANDTTIVIPAGEFVKTLYTQSIAVTSNERVQLMSYMAGSLDGVQDYYSWGSSAMICPPIAQWYNNVDVYVPPFTDSVNNFVEIISEDTSSIRMRNENNDRIALKWSMIPGTNWKTTSTHIDRNHVYHVQSSDQHRFIAYCYGAIWGHGSIIHYRGPSYDTILNHHYDKLSLAYSFPFSGYIDSRELSINISDSDVATHPTIKVFPNPGQDFLDVYLPREIESVIVLDVMDCLGRVVMHREYSNAWDGSFRLDISDIVRGSYLLRVQSGTAIEVVRFVKS